MGKFADFVMLDRDLFKEEPEAIHRVEVVWTVIVAREMYRTAELE